MSKTIHSSTPQIENPTSISNEEVQQPIRSDSVLASRELRFGQPFVSAKPPKTPVKFVSVKSDELPSHWKSIFDKVTGYLSSKSSYFRSFLRWANGEKELEKKGYSPELLNEINQTVVSFPKECLNADHAVFQRDAHPSPTRQLVKQHLRDELIANNYSPSQYMLFLLQNKNMTVEVGGTRFTNLKAHAYAVGQLNPDDLCEKLNPEEPETLEKPRGVGDVARRLVAIISESVREPDGTVDPTKFQLAYSLGYPPKTISLIERSAGMDSARVLKDCLESGLPPDVAELMVQQGMNLSRTEMEWIQGYDRYTLTILTARGYQAQDIVKLTPEEAAYCLQKRVPADVAKDCIDGRLELNDLVVTRLKAGRKLRANGYSPQLIAFMPVSRSGFEGEYLQDIESCTYRIVQITKGEFEKKETIKPIDTFWTQAVKRGEKYLKSQRDLPEEERAPSFIQKFRDDVLDRNREFLAESGFGGEEGQLILNRLSAREVLQLVDDQHYRELVKEQFSL